MKQYMRLIMYCNKIQDNYEYKIIRTIFNKNSYFDTLIGLVSGKY